MFESYLKPAATKASPEPLPQAGILSPLIPMEPGAGERLQAAVMRPGILTLTPEQLAEEEERRRREQAAAGGWAPLIMRLPGQPSPPLPGPATQPAPGKPGYNPAWNGLAPGMPQPVQYFAPSDPAYGYQDQMAVRNSAGL